MNYCTPEYKLLFISSTDLLFNFIMPRECKKNHPNSFCYVCSELILKAQWKFHSPLLKTANHFHFDYQVGDQDKDWTLFAALLVTVARLNGKKVTVNLCFLLCPWSGANLAIISQIVTFVQRCQLLRITRSHYGKLQKNFSFLRITENLNFSEGICFKSSNQKCCQKSAK